MHTTGNENINGTKNFKNYLRIGDESGQPFKDGEERSIMGFDWIHEVPQTAIKGSIMDGVGTALGNVHLSIGSQYSMTHIGSGESRRRVIKTLLKDGTVPEETEGLVFTSDSNMQFFTSCPNDGSAWVQAMRLDNNGTVQLPVTDTRSYPNKNIISQNMHCELGYPTENKANVNYSMMLYDKNVHQVSSVNLKQPSNGDNAAFFRVQQPDVAKISNGAEAGIYWPLGSTTKAYAYGPLTNDADPDRALVTMSYLRGLFLKDLYFTGNTGKCVRNIILKNPETFNAGTMQSQYKNFSMRLDDGDSKICAAMSLRQESDGRNDARWYVYKPGHEGQDDAASATVQLSLTYPLEGEPWTHTIHPRANASDDEIASVKYVKDRTRIRLFANMNIYVNPTTGADSIIYNRGTKELPFKTIHAALQYVNNYLEIGPYVVFIKLSEGTHNGPFSIFGGPLFNSGYIRITKDEDCKNRPIVKYTATNTNTQSVNMCQIRGPILVSICDVDFEVTISKGVNGDVDVFEIGAGRTIYQGGELEFFSSNVTINDQSGGTAAKLRFFNLSRSYLALRNNTVLNYVDNGKKSSTVVFNVVDFSIFGINHAGDDVTDTTIDVNGNMDTILAMSRQCYFRRATSSRHITFTSTKGCTGKRYEITVMSYADVNGGGQNFFPGSTAGTCKSSQYCLYY